MIHQRFYKRRDLIPSWMKFFMWIFMLLVGLSIVLKVSEFLGFSFWFNSGEKTIYGMETYESYSFLAIFIVSILYFKGITAFGMWAEKDWAIQFGIIDAVLGIIICSVMMFIEPLFVSDNGEYNLNFRFELLLLIPYLIKCLKIRKPWEEFKRSTSLKTIPIDEFETEPVPIQEIELEKVIEEEIAIEEKIDKEDPRRFMPKNIFNSNSPL